MNNQRHTQDASEIISRLSDRFVQHERYSALQRAVDRLIALRLSDLRAGRTNEAQSLVLTAATGSGKTTAMERLIKHANARLQKTDFPDASIISLTVPPLSTFKSLGISILDELGLEIKADRKSWYIWKLVQFHLSENKVMFVHLDEAQDLKTKGRQNELPEIVNTFKLMSQNKAWPVGFLLSGTQELKEIVNFDKQLVRRMKAVRFDPLTARSDAFDILSLVENYASQANLKFDNSIGSEDLGRRILHASTYQFGLVIKLAILALEEALYAGDTSLEPSHFAIAFKDWKGCTDAFNPFLVNDYLQIDTQRMFTTEEDV